MEPETRYPHTPQPHVRLPRVRPYQAEPYRSPARFKLLLTGRRWGKGKLALRCAALGHGPRQDIQDPHRTVDTQATRPRWPGALHGARIGWIVPTEHHPATLEAWRDLRAALAPAATAVSEAHRLITLPGGGSVQVRSAHDPEHLRGPFFDGVAVDECGIQHPRVWSVLRPTLSDYGGWALLLGNVPDDVVDHWFVKLSHLAGTSEMAAHGWAAWRRPTWDNPQIPQADLDEARRTLGPTVFQREYAAELVGAEGGVWRADWFRDRSWTALPEGITCALLTLDAAWTTGIRSDHSAAQLWAKAPAGYYLVDELRGRWESPELRRRVAAFRARWAPTFQDRLGLPLPLPLYVESAGGGLVSAQEFKAACDFPVREYSPPHSSKIARNEAVAPLAETGQVWLPHPSRAPWVTDYLAELVGFPRHPHDDRCDATAMALQLLRTALQPARAILRPPPEFRYSYLGNSPYA